MANEGTGSPGQIQGRHPDDTTPEDIFVLNGVVYVGLRYFDGSGNPQAQGQIALETTAQAILTEVRGRNYGFAGLYEVGDMVYVASEDGSGNYIIMRIDDSKLGTATDDDTMFTTGTGGLPAKAGWAALTYADRATTF